MYLYNRIPEDVPLRGSDGVQLIIDEMVRDNGDEVINELKFYITIMKFNKCVAAIIRYWNGYNI